MTAAAPSSNTSSTVNDDGSITTKSIMMTEFTDDHGDGSSSLIDIPPSSSVSTAPYVASSDNSSPEGSLSPSMAEEPTTESFVESTDVDATATADKNVDAVMIAADESPKYNVVPSSHTNANATSASINNKEEDNMMEVDSCTVHEHQTSSQTSAASSNNSKASPKRNLVTNSNASIHPPVVFHPTTTNNASSNNNTVNNTSSSSNIKSYTPLPSNTTSKKRNNRVVKVDAATVKMLASNLDGRLDALQESISVAILVLRADKHDSSSSKSQQQLLQNNDTRKEIFESCAKLRDAAKEAYHSLVQYGRLFDLSASAAEGGEDAPKAMELQDGGSTANKVYLSEVRRSRLLNIGRNLWMTIRSNPDLFNDLIAEEKDVMGSGGGGDYLRYKGKKYRAIAAGYVRTIAARLVFLNYIDTRCSIGCPPSLHSSLNANQGKSPAVQELVFGLKIFSRAGKALLTHSREDASASHDTLSLAVACFNAIKNMSHTNGEASREIKGLLDEAFDAFSLLPTSASVYGENAVMTDESVEDWSSLVLSHLKGAEAFLQQHCNVAFEGGEENSLSVSKVNTLQRYLPALARLCFKHGSNFAKLMDFKAATDSLHIALKTTDSCLREVRLTLENSSSSIYGQGRKGMQKNVLHNLESELVVVSIEAFYLLTQIFQSTGEKGKAISCLDQIEKYMKEQQNRDDELFTTVMRKLGEGKDFGFSESSVIEDPKKQDKVDLKARASSARVNAKKRHVKEKATLAFSRIRVYHKSLSGPAPDEEALIDRLLREMVDLSMKFTSPDASSAQHAIAIQDIFVLTMDAIRMTHVRRRISKMTGGSVGVDPYRQLLDKFPKSHFRYPYILLDKLNAMLTSQYQLRELQVDIRGLDDETLSMAQEYLEIAKPFFDKRSNVEGSTLVASSAQSASKDLFEETKSHFARAVSLYHSSHEFDLCAQWTAMFESILRCDDTSLVDEAMIGEIQSVRAFALSMSGNSAEGLMTRKQRAEEILWATLTDVLYRHGDKQSKDEERKRRERMERRARALEAAARGEGNANSVNMSTIAEDSDEDDSNSYTHTANSFEDDASTKSGKGDASSAGGNTNSSSGGKTAPATSSGVTTLKRMVGRALLESEIDLEGDELRCLEEPAAWGSSYSSHTHLPASYLYPEQALPRYSDPVLALRILVDCLTKLKRLDDVEQYLSEGIEREIRQVAEREQAKTYARLERRRGRPTAMSSVDGGEGGGEGNGGDDGDELKEFRIHLNNLLKAFGGVMTRFLHLTQILRHKICSDPILEKMCPSYPVPESALHSVLVTAERVMQSEIKGFLSACIAESDKPKDKRKSRSYNAMNLDQSQSDVERGIFSLGIASSVGGMGGEAGWKKATTRANIVELPADQFVSNVLFPKTNTDPEVRHALTFRRSISRWAHEITEGKRELAICSLEDTTSPMYNDGMEEGALAYMDNIIQRTLLPEMQDEAVNAVIHFLERHDAFDPIVSDVFTRYPNHTVHLEAEMSVACQALYTSTRPIFMALHRLPKGGDMYLSLVTMLEHAMLTFISRMKQRVGKLLHAKVAFTLLEDQRGNESQLNQAMERRKAFALLQRIYNDEDDVDDSPTTVEPNIRGGILPLAPSHSDTSPKKGKFMAGADGKDSFERELTQLNSLAKFTEPLKFGNSTLCTDEELMKAACLANSLLRVASLLEEQLRSKAGGWEKSAKSSAIRDLESAIKTIRFHGLRVAKFCRMEVLVQTAKRMSEICMSSVLQAEDAVRLPSCVNNLGEYLTTSSDSIREAGGNAIAAYSFSSLEQYIPFYLMQSARTMASGSMGKLITMNGIESLDRTGSVLYRDLKGATSFENSFWDEDAAAHSFEQSAIFISLMEISQKDLEDYYRGNPNQFSDDDYKLMFSFDGPRRRGDKRRLNLLKSKIKTERGR
eukprot:g15028.t1 g15028   contig21:392906-399472(-)